MQSIQYIIACCAGLVISRLSRVIGYGAGGTWPGEIALRIYPAILSKLAKRIQKGVIVVAGTNGKTTTALMIAGVLRQAGNSVLHNTSGANLLNGIVSSFFVSWKYADWAIFEVDENALPLIVRFVKPDVLVLLNLFRDQLDRYGEVDAIASSWKAAVTALGVHTTIVANGDDPAIAAITDGLHAKLVYIGLENPDYYLPKMQHATDSIYCPKCGTRLTFGGVYFSHLGKWACGSCGFTHPDILIKAADYTSPLEGVYNVYNTLAAAAVGEVLHHDKGAIQQSLDQFHPAFGRMEDVRYHGAAFRILLSKNPTGFNESIRTVLLSDKKGPLVVALNDRIPDGTDVSWIWDVDFEQLENFSDTIVVSGDRAHDMGVRILYTRGSGNRKSPSSKKKSKTDVVVETDLEVALDEAVKKAKDTDTIWVLATYSAMLDVRNIITGRKIL